jgi:hypothetical protein
MRRVVIASILTLALWSALAVSAPRAARAEGGPFGLGLIIGSPTGISLKYYLGDSGQAIDGAVGFSFLGADGVHVHADYLWHPFMLTQDAAFSLPMHVGVGVRLLDHDRGRDGDDDFHVGIRAPVGLTFDFTEVPLDVFVEIALILDFHGDHKVNVNDDDDNVDLDLNAGVGVRYYF